MELLGERKANALWSAGMESLCERYDGLKHENRKLRDALAEIEKLIKGLAVGE
jgi:hypothetical protein